MTYSKAKAKILDALEAQGWDVRRDLKVPHATSPHGRLYFKAQSIYADRGRPPYKLAQARSLHLDMRELALLTPVEIDWQLRNELWEQLPHGDSMPEQNPIGYTAEGAITFPDRRVTPRPNYIYVPTRGAGATWVAMKSEFMGGKRAVGWVAIEDIPVRFDEVEVYDKLNDKMIRQVRTDDDPIEMFRKMIVQYGERHDQYVVQGVRNDGSVVIDNQGGPGGWIRTFDWIKSRNPQMSTEARELLLYIQNDGELYRQRTVPIQENLLKKMRKGTYDSQKAVKAWKHLADAGAKKYAKEFATPGQWHRIFPVPVRNEVAKALAEDFEAEVSVGAWENPAPEKLKDSWLRKIEEQGQYGYQLQLSAVSEEDYDAVWELYKEGKVYWREDPSLPVVWVTAKGPRFGNPGQNTKKLKSKLLR